MKQKVVCTVLVSMLLLFTMLFTGTQRVEASSTVVYVDPEISYATVGQTFSVNVSIANVTDLYGVEFKLYWNTTILDGVNSTIVGPRDPKDLFIAKNKILDDYNATHGRYWCGYSVLAPTPPFSGNTTLVSLTFKAEETGNCTLDLCDTGLWSYPNADEIPHEVHDGYARARASALGPWDLNGDEVINIADIVIIAIHFGGAAVDDPETGWDETELWDPFVDLNRDEVINIADIVIVGIHFGETW